MDLHEIRDQIDNIDNEIIALLAERSGLVSAAGELKKDEQAVRDPERVERVITKVKEKASLNGLAPDIAERVYRVIIDCFINKELREFSENDQTM